MERIGAVRETLSPDDGNNLESRRTPNLTSTEEPSTEKCADGTSISLIPLSVIINLLVGPSTVVQSSGGGGTTNDLDWNDERKRAHEAKYNHFKNSKT